jgi:hypothetical protein
MRTLYTPIANKLTGAMNLKICSTKVAGKIKVAGQELRGLYTKQQIAMLLQN